jgi:hypothetical protein
LQRIAIVVTGDNDIVAVAVAVVGGVEGSINGEPRTVAIELVPESGVNDRSVVGKSGDVNRSGIIEIVRVKDVTATRGRSKVQPVVTGPVSPGKGIGIQGESIAVVMTGERDLNATVDCGIG